MNKWECRVHRLALQLAALALATLGLNDRAGAQSAPPTLTADTLRAKTLIEAALRQVGGRDRLSGMKDLHAALTGESFFGRQGYDPANIDKALSIGSYTLKVDFDFDHHRYRRDNLQVLPGGIRLDAVTLYKDGTITNAYPGGGRKSQSPGAEPALRDLLARFIPAMLLRRAMETSSTATYVGRRREGGRLSEMVDISLDPATRIAPL